MQEKNINIANNKNFINQHGKMITDEDKFIKEAPVAIVPKEHVHDEHCNHEHKIDLTKNSILECFSCKEKIKGRPFESYGKPLCKNCFLKIHTPVINTNKIGRNDKCYCGSGKKFKRCHGNSL